MAVNYIYKIDKGYEKGVLGKFFHDSKLQSCSPTGESAGAMKVREYVVKGKPRIKIFEFKKATYIKSEAEIRHSNIITVRNLRD